MIDMIESASLPTKSSNAPSSRQEDLREAARQFESLMLRQLYGEMQRSVQGADHSMAAEFFEDHLVEHLADLSSRQGGIGIADVLMRAWGVDDQPGAEVEMDFSIHQSDRVSPREIERLASWNHPLPTGRVSSSYGARVHPITGEERFHHGLDLAAPEGTPIHPVAPGRVVFSGSRGGYGNLVEVEHPDGWTTRYAHAEELLVAEGDWVTPERPLATVGQTGAATGPHLHFEARRGSRSFDPAHLLHHTCGGEQE